MIVHDNILIVPVPDDAHEFILTATPVNETSLAYLRGTIGVPSFTYWETNIPPGLWRIVGRVLDLTKEQWQELVKQDASGWYDYERDNPRCINPFFSAIESGVSLLRSHGIDPESNPLILIKENNTP